MSSRGRVPRVPSADEGGGRGARDGETGEGESQGHFESTSERRGHSLDTRRTRPSRQRGPRSSSLVCPRRRSRQVRADRGTHLPARLDWPRLDPPPSLTRVPPRPASWRPLARHSLRTAARSRDPASDGDGTGACQRAEEIVHRSAGKEKHRATCSFHARLFLFPIFPFF
ncbi:hypothetical protein PUN28_017248 [Cardiocondyla obscurior]|uniref:Histone H3 n=1 Tax=Cardiocondyla obscurior TaxID=286306 RepID=A0AAW2ERU4_9HYME